MTKKAYIEELEDPHLGGTFLTSSSPIFDLNNEFIGSVHVVRDVTELKKPPVKACHVPEDGRSAARWLPRSPMR